MKRKRTGNPFIRKRWRLNETWKTNTIDQIKSFNFIPFISTARTNNDLIIRLSKASEMNLILPDVIITFQTKTCSR